MSLTLAAHQIEAALPRVEAGLAKYRWLQNQLSVRDVSSDREYQKRFAGFYRVRRNATWRASFFETLELAKRRPLVFEEALRALHVATGRVEASFASKLVATVDPLQPVIDSVVLRNLGLKLPAAGAPDRLRAIANLHTQLSDLFASFLASEPGRALVTQFRRAYPDAGISEIKMLDLVLWQTRETA